MYLRTVYTYIFSWKFPLTKNSTRVYLHSWTHGDLHTYVQVMRALYVHSYTVTEVIYNNLYGSSCVTYIKY